MTELSLSSLSGIGPRVTEKLAKLHIHDVLDLAFHLPLRYEDRTRIAPIASLRPGERALIEGQRLGIREVYGQRRSLLITLGDTTGSITLRLFHYSRAMRTRLENAQVLRCFGETRPGPRALEMVHPEIQTDQGIEPLAETLDPVYPSTDGLQQRSLRKFVAQALNEVQSKQLLEELLPKALSEHYQLPPLMDSLWRVHHPNPAEAARFEDSAHRPD